MSRDSAILLARHLFLILAGASLALSPVCLAAGQSSANFAMPRDTINAGVGDSSSANFRLSSSVGDAVAGGAIASVGFQLKSGFRGEVSAPPAVLNLLSVFSRKFHNGTPFDLTIAHAQPIAGSISVEPRAIGAGHMVVFRFDNPISAEGAAAALDSALNSAATVTLARAGNDVIATLTNVADNKRLTLKLTGVNGSTNAEASFGFLIGDVGSTKQVTAADISAVKANVGKPVNNISTARFDLNADGSITQADVSVAKAQSGKVLP
ncbi:MAG: dockerin type I domain-containing protein [Betaproteobacteria bacterium]